MSIALKAATLAVLTAAAGASAAAITPGNLVIYRVGDGAGTLVNTGNAVFVDEYTTAGTLVQSIALPATAASNNLVASGTATSEGLLSVSPDGRYVTVTGYDRAVGGTGSLSGTTSSTVGRTIGLITASSGAVNTSTVLTDYASGNNPRSAVTTDGTNFYAVGGAGGVRLAALGGTTSTSIASDAVNLRQVNVFNGQLFASSSAGTNTFRGVNTIGTGVPSTSGQTTARLPGLTDATSGNSYAFFFADLTPVVAGADTLYIADESAGVQKFSLVDGNWTANGAVAAASIRGLTGSVSGSVVNLFGTTGGGTASGGGSLYGLIDTSGYNAAINGTTATLANAAANTAFRGVGFVAAVPEPAGMALLGVAGVAVLRRRRRMAK